MEYFVSASGYTLPVRDLSVVDADGVVLMDDTGAEVPDQSSLAIPVAIPTYEPIHLRMRRMVALYQRDSSVGSETLDDLEDFGDDERTFEDYEPYPVDDGTARVSSESHSRRGDSGLSSNDGGVDASQSGVESD